MKAGVFYGPGDVRVEDIVEPRDPAPGEVVLRVLMGSLCGTDASQFKAATMVPLTQPHPVSGHVGPVVLGHEVVGEVIATGAGVNNPRVGQRVVPGCGWWCGTCPQCQAGRLNICERYFLYGIHANGGLAKLAAFPAKMCVPVPDGCTDAAAAMAQPCAVALHAVSRANIAPGQTVALFGLGSIGSLLLAVLRAQRQDVSVLAVDIEPKRLAVARALGAICVIDAGATDPVAEILSLTDGHGVELALEATGMPETMVHALASVARGGRLVQVGIPPQPVALPIGPTVVHEKDIITTNGQVTTVDLPQALTLLADTGLAASVGYRVISLDDLVEEGLRPLAEHRAPAKVLVQVNGQAGEAPERRSEAFGSRTQADG